VTPRETIAAVRRLGTDLSASGDKIRWRGPLTAELRAGLARDKVAVLAVLRAEAGLCSECGASLGLNGRAARLALVNEDGSATCYDCLEGYTLLRARGVPI
jgi:hypothetical protein